MPKGQPGTKAPHGTLTRYTSHSCRCSLCRAAMRNWRRDKYGYRPREVVNAERAARVRHGSETMYVDRGCRCDACREASNAARRRRNAADPELARARWREQKRRQREGVTE